MNAEHLEQGFRLGEWRVAPGELRIAGPSGVRELHAAQLRLLLALASDHGEAVSSSELATLIGLDAEHDAVAFTEAMNALGALLGDSPARRRHIVPIGDDAYALVAHFEQLEASQNGAIHAAVPATQHNSVSVAGAATTLGHIEWLVVELRRRHVVKVCGAYLIGTWITLQVAEVTFHPLHLPGWWMTALTIAAVIGLPIVAVLAWSYEITSAGIQLDVSPAGAAHMQLPRARRSLAPVLVAGVALLAVITGFAWWRTLALDTDVAAVASGAGLAPLPAPDAPGSPSIAVLPLLDLSPGGGFAYLGQGLSEEMSMRLAQVEGLRVAARTSAFEFKDRAADVRKIGQLLGVNHVLEGSVRRDGDHLRVTVQLIDARTGFHAWAQNYDRRWTDVLAIQDDIAREVAHALEVVLTPNARAPGAVAKDLDLGAFDAYLAGLALLRQASDPGSLEQAAARFEQALALEPAFARAHAGLCEIGSRRHQFTRDPGDLVVAEQHCIRALELDSTLLETEKALASLYVAGGRFAAAKVAYEQLLTKHPSDADGAIGLGRALEGEGDRAGAETNYRRAVAMEPGFWGAYKALGTFLFGQGRLREAIEAYRRVVELTPSSASAHNNLGAALQMQGSLEEASRSFERSLRLEPSRAAYSNLGSSYYYLGRFEQAAQMYVKATALATQDQNVWGNLADALWQMPARREEAVATYRRAIALGERDLVQTPRQAELLAQLAYYYAQVNDTARSLQRASEANAADATNPYARYYTALAAIGRGELRAAVTELEAAVAAGYPATTLATAPELAGIRGEREFAALVARSSAPASDTAARKQ